MHKRRGCIWCGAEISVNEATSISISLQMRRGGKETGSVPAEVLPAAPLSPRQPPKPCRLSETWPERNERLVFAVVVLVALFTRFYRLDQPAGVVFDEVRGVRGVIGGAARQSVRFLETICQFDVSVSHLPTHAVRLCRPISASLLAGICVICFTLTSTRHWAS